MRRLAETFVEETADALELLGRGQHKLAFSPWALLISSFLLTSIASFSVNSLALVIPVVISFILVSLSRQNIRNWTSFVLLVFIMTALISAPLPLIVAGRPIASLSLGSLTLAVTQEGVNEAALLISRTVIAAAVFSAAVSHLGWDGLLIALTQIRVPRRVVLMMGFMLRYIPLFLRDCFEVIAAREARQLRKLSYKDIWNALATVVGEVVVRGYERAWRLEKAIKARTLVEGTITQNTGFDLRIGDLVILLVSLTSLLTLIG